MKHRRPKTFAQMVQDYENNNLRLRQTAADLITAFDHHQPCNFHKAFIELRVLVNPPRESDDE